MKQLIQPYKHNWKIQFTTIQKILANTLGGLMLRIEHVGSTSVPNLAAKAIIDIDIVYEKETVFPQICERLASLGYYHNGDQGVPKREAFKRKKNQPKHPILDAITHHLYACPKDSPELRRHLLFRDFLKKHAWARLEYAALKRQIANQTNQNKAAYSLLKESAGTPFIEKILALAKDEFSI